MLLLKLIAAVALSQSVQPEVSRTPISGAWKQVGGLKAASIEWQKIQSRIDDQVRSMKNHSPIDRSEKLRSEVARYLEMGDDVTAYRRARYVIEFWSEISNLHLGPRYLMYVSDAQGSRDPIFVRDGFKALCLNGNGFGFRESLGADLIAMFPDDRLLKKAYAYHGLQECKDEARILKSRSVAELVKDLWIPLDYVAFNAQIYEKLYLNFKKKVYLDEAIRYLREFVAVVKDPKRKKTAQTYLKQREQDLAAKRYKGSR
jgi:hypothetical protein